MEGLIFFQNPLHNVSFELAGVASAHNPCSALTPAFPVPSLCSSIVARDSRAESDQARQLTVVDGELKGFHDVWLLFG